MSGLPMALKCIQIAQFKMGAVSGKVHGDMFSEDPKVLLERAIALLASEIDLLERTRKAVG